MNHDFLSRRHFLAQSSAASLALAGLSAKTPGLLGAEEAEKPSYPQGKAEHCIFIWLGGGACHIDTWDPKRKGDGRKTPGSYYEPISTAISGVQVCEHLQRTAPLLDRCAIVRTVHHGSIDEHAAATNLVHTGRPTSGTIVYPSVGSIVSHMKGAADDNVPAYVVMGYPNVTRGPGFLGAKYSYIYLTETEVGPNGLKRPDSITSTRQSRREGLLTHLRKDLVQRHSGDKTIADYSAALESGFRLSGPKFMNVFDLKNEKADLRESYGSEFGQRLLLSRRLIQSGVRFIEVASNLNFVNGTGWDTHNQGQRKLHELIQELDRGLSTLITDLEHHKLLDSTLIVVATEFGRPPEFDGGGGRGHHGKAFSVVLGGGGLRTGRTIGETDELGRVPVSQPVSVPDLHATIHCALGIDPSTELYDGERPVPITDRGQPIRELFS